MLAVVVDYGELEKKKTRLGHTLVFALALTLPMRAARQADRLLPLARHFLCFCEGWGEFGVTPMEYNRK